MKKTNAILMLFLLIFSQKICAQITQLEFASGISKTDFTSFSIRPIDDKKTFSIATLAFFQKYHEKEHEVFDELGVQTTALWNFSKFIAVGPSLYYNSVAGFSERISVFFSTKTKRFSIAAIPSIAHMELTNFINGELFLQMQFLQPLKNDWNALLSALMLTHWDKFSIHARSFQQVRTGISYKSTQFGLAVDFDQYGKTPITKTSVGLFVRKIFINK
ncbi:hypothetical protein [Hyunsoonleella pacifica]|uniref:DUF2490 domain-containing protein n=1 Tax=Hyunsoonleella pacifica TaxID=1080224 RepID=A0A4Q9FK49_9FLAO|nr:hypothetical protein [Hyunsoonleella pacifica]TBN13792.1 hypothetical protein EYD46_14960 [Hyunsoonleella pacifica]GGD25679.1 hypothetical protein GCM10011368_29680 [Hyunsoonleella pacifica]